MSALDQIAIESDVTLLGTEAAARPAFKAAWQDLCTRAAVGNPFYTPAFLLPLLNELNLSDVQIACLGSPETGLRAIAPIVTNRLYGFGPRLTRLWVHAFIPLGTPLVARGDGDAFHNFLTGLMAITNAPVLTQDFVGRTMLFDGQKAKAIEGDVITSAQRAALTASLKGDEYRHQTLSKQRRQGLNRRFRKLAEKTKHLGALTIQLADTPETVPAAFEDFMRLEKLGWKGGNKTALLNDESHARFARRAAQNLSEQGACIVATLKAGDTVLAALTTMRANEALFSWKTAFDESYADCSPGAQLLARFADDLMGPEQPIHLDSCSSPDNAIANALWGERIVVEEVLFYGKNQRLAAKTLKQLKMLHRQAKLTAHAILRDK